MDAAARLHAYDAYFEAAHRYGGIPPGGLHHVGRERMALHEPAGRFWFACGQNKDFYHWRLEGAQRGTVRPVAAFH
jgi:hypothetical protein